MPPKKQVKKSKSQTTSTSKDNDYKLVITGLSYKTILHEHLNINKKPAKNKGIAGKQSRNVEYIEDIPPKTSSIVIPKQDDGSKDKIKPEYFLDSKKNKIKLWQTMVDSSNNDILPLYTNKPCKSCHHPYETHPIGCPIKYIPHHQDPNDLKRKKIEKFLKDNNFLYDSTDYFECEHLFCSFPCIKLYIMGKLSITPSSYKYTNALTYLSLLYKKLFSLKGTPTIPSAHDIDVLISYGGHLSISEYRNTVGLLQFDKVVNIKRPIMFSSFSYMEETAARTEKDYVQ